MRRSWLNMPVFMLLVVFSVVMAFAVIALTLPISLLFLLSVLIWWKTRSAHSAPGKGAHAALPPLLAGFAALMLLLLIFNLIPPAHDITVVGKVEDHLRNL